nr:MAG TPA: hypothetical protein [Caudoviricetes sp.]
MVCGHEHWLPTLAAGLPFIKTVVLHPGLIITLPWLLVKGQACSLTLSPCLAASLPLIFTLLLPFIIGAGGKQL